MDSESVIQWGLRFDLVDGGDGLRRSTDLIGKLQDSFQKLKNVAGDSLSGIGNSIKQFTASSIGSSLASIGLSASLFSAAGAATALGLAFNELDKFTDQAVDAFSKRTNALRVYTTVLGSAKKAQEEFSFVSALGQQTDFTREQIEGVSRKLTTSGFKDDEDRRKAELTIADIATTSSLEQRQGSINRLSQAFAAMKGAKYLQAKDLKAFTGMLGTSGIRDEIAKSMGIKRNTVDDAIREKKVSADVAISAIQNALLKQYGTSKIGEFATGGAGDITTMLSNQEEASQNALLAIKPETLASYELFKSSIQDITNIMDSGRESGKNYGYFIETISEIGMAIKSFINSFKAGFLTGFLDVFRYLRELFSFREDFGDTQRALEGLKKVFKAIGIVIGAIAAVVAVAFVTAWDFALNLINSVIVGWRFMWALIKDSYAYISDVFKGIFNGLSTIFNALATIITGVINLSVKTIKEGYTQLTKTSFTAGGADPNKTYTENQQEVVRAIAKENADAVARALADKKKNKDGKDDEKDLDSAGGGGRGKHGKGHGGYNVDFNNYGGPLSDISAYMATLGHTNPMLSLDTSAARAINGPERLQPIKPQITIDSFIQNITGGSSSPKEIANEVYHKFTQEIGRRIVRSPMPSVT